MIANTPDTLISGNWLITAIGALSTAAALIIGKSQGRKEAESRDVNIKKPVPTIQTREEPRWATKPELDEHIMRINSQLKEMRLQHNEEIVSIHERINQQSSVLAETKGKTEQINGKVDQLLTLALHRRGGSDS